MAPLGQHIFIVAYAVVLLGGLLLFWKPFSLNPSEWAAWVQAIGSVGALFTMVYVQKRTAHEIMKRDALAKSALLQGQRTLIASALANLHSVISRCNINSGRSDWKKTYAQATKLEIETTINDLKKVDISQFDDAEILSLIYESKSLAFACHAVVSDISESLPKQGSKSRFSSASEVMADLWGRLIRLLPDEATEADSSAPVKIARDA